MEDKWRLEHLGSLGIMGETFMACNVRLSFLLWLYGNVVVWKISGLLCQTEFSVVVSGLVWDSQT